MEREEGEWHWHYGKTTRLPRVPSPLPQSPSIERTKGKEGKSREETKFRDQKGIEGLAIGRYTLTHRNGREERAMGGREGGGGVKGAIVDTNRRVKDEG